jgi:hypothetical protein
MNIKNSNMVLIFKSFIIAAAVRHAHGVAMGVGTRSASYPGK